MPVGVLIRWPGGAVHLGCKPPTVRCWPASRAGAAVQPARPAAPGLIALGLLRCCCSPGPPGSARWAWPALRLVDAARTRATERSLPPSPGEASCTRETTRNRRKEGRTQELRPTFKSKMLPQKSWILEKNKTLPKTQFLEKLQIHTKSVRDLMEDHTKVAHKYPSNKTHQQISPWSQTRRSYYFNYYMVI